MQYAITYRIIFPRKFSGFLVECDECRSFRRRDVDMTLILTVGSADEKQISVRYRRTIRHVMRLRSDFFHHVELPDDIGISLTSQLLVLIRSIVLAVAKPLRVKTHNLAAIAH